MPQTRRQIVEESRRKGVTAGAAVAATVALGVVGLPVAAAMAAVPSAWLGWRWWKHRAQNGIKF
jgi:Spy/CpxP family protein refolding chaperone